MIKELLISLHTFCKLIIFSLLFFLPRCEQKKDNSSKEKVISIIWKDGRAAAISIPAENLDHVSKDSIPSQVELRLANPGEQPVLPGEFIISKTEIIFEPLIPFTRGLRYKVFVDNKLYNEIEIPKSTEIPRLLAIYPTPDTLPENLLKIYLVFSKPMVEGQSLKHVKLLDQKGDTLPQIFLELQHELWNDERTILTLWLDPGRIKRDLQPNKLLGPPLIKGGNYKLIISADWFDQQGNHLDKIYTKNIIATDRDTVLPQPESWVLKTPKAGTNELFYAEFHESLDYMLINHTIHIIDPAGKILNGSIQINDLEKGFSFKPATSWSPGLYKLTIETHLEDLAGNNLIRLFDRDLRSGNESVVDKKKFEREWRIN